MLSWIVPTWLIIGEAVILTTITSKAFKQTIRQGRISAAAIVISLLLFGLFWWYYLVEAIIVGWSTDNAEKP